MACNEYKQDKHKKKINRIVSDSYESEKVEELPGLNDKVG
jgi:hypothetical protein